MKLKIYNQKTLPSSRGGKKTNGCYIRINQKGYMSLSYLACQTLSLAQDGRIEFAFNEEEKRLFVFKSSCEYGYQAHKTKRDKNIFSFNSVALSQKIWEMIGLNGEKSIKLPIFQEGIPQNEVTLFEIATQHAQNDPKNDAKH